MIDDAAVPMAKRVLVVSKDIIDKVKTSVENEISGIRRVQANSVESCDRLKQQARRILTERATSMTMKVSTFAR